nr:PREDICTED: acetoacetyl-CoA synthetase [Latimeria chalumnae]|eukprot:XP_014339562.1 PREDICTED: acetoacetyl-CoA synthetase [Latimeria chalumnae]
MSKDREVVTEAIMEAKVMWYPPVKKNTHLDTFRAELADRFGLRLGKWPRLAGNCHSSPAGLLEADRPQPPSRPPALVYKTGLQFSPSNYIEVEFQLKVEVFLKSFGTVPQLGVYSTYLDVKFLGTGMSYSEKEKVRPSPECYINNLRSLDKVVREIARLMVSTEECKEEITKVTFGELRKDVALYAAAMRKMGVRAGDRVVGYLPNSIHAVEAMLAAASIGAIWSSTSPDFGVNGVLDRFSQIQPKIIFSVDAVIYNGKEHNHMEKLQNVVKGLPDLKKVIVIPYVQSKKTIDVSKIPNSVFLEDFLATGKEGDQAPQLEFEQLPFSHPLFIMYSSGTTGAPKCMVHSAGGTLIQHIKEHILHGNMTSSDVIIYYTTTGWMMWNWLVSALFTGASVVLYDGSPLVPSPCVLWNLVDQLGITIFGTGAKWLSVLEEKKLKPCKCFTCFSGTDIISCFMGQNFTIPVYKGEIQARNLGMPVEAWNDEGKPVWGESGELVCTKPIPCQPTQFWNDENGSKYRKAYFSRFPGTWSHGDYCKINPKTGGIIMLGRSDGTLNPNGVRFGSSEIYNIVEAFEEVSDSLCVPQYNKDGEERVILFLKMATNHTFSQDLVKSMKQAIRVALSARHVPAFILETKDIPYTISGKKVEVAVKHILAGKEVTQRGTFSNPGSLDLFRNIPELQDF